MADTIKVVHVFIGSPGGLEEERAAAHEVVKAINRSNSDHWGCLIKLHGWEDVVPGYVRPQSKINDDLDKCDYFLGVLWNHWGSTPSSEPDGHSSGFEEEYHRATQRISEGLMKDLAIYFKEVDVPSGMMPNESYQKVLDFKQICIQEKKVFYKQFEDIDSFRDIIREKLTEIGWRESPLTQEKAVESSKSEQAAQSSPNSEDSSGRGPGLLDDSARLFLNALVSKSSEWGRTHSYEFARLRLIATTLRNPENDDLYLGNHDANLVFRYLRNEPLSHQEMFALIGCGIAGFQYQNVPLWRWLAERDVGGDPFSVVRLKAALSDQPELRNAITLLDLGKQPIPSINEHFNERLVLKHWVSPERNGHEVDAAVIFLSENAAPADIRLIEEVAADSGPEVRAKLESAIIGILSRSSATAALTRLVERKVSQLEPRVISRLFENPGSLTTDILALCVSANSDDVRRCAVEILFERKEISLAVAKSLLTDSNFEIRLVAAERLKELGHELDEDVLRKALVLDKRTGLLLRSTRSDGTYYARYQFNRLSELGLESLKQRAAEAGVFKDKELAALYLKFPSKTQQEIRRNLADGFKEVFEAALKEAALPSDRLTEIREIESFYRGRVCNNALAALCKLQNKNDLELARSVVDNFDIDGSESLLKFFARFGDWSDIERIAKLRSPSGYFIYDEAKSATFYRELAKTIFSIGKDRIADLLDLDLNREILTYIVCLMPSVSIKKLSEELIFRELNRDSDEYRAIFAVRCVQSIPKGRLKKILEEYVDSDEHRYYNSIHWIDLGVSFSQKLAKSIADRKIGRFLGL